jgi:hypothetical protein
VTPQDVLVRGGVTPPPVTQPFMDALKR